MGVIGAVNRLLAVGQWHIEIVAKVPMLAVPAQ
jgi:hypothetical protein